MNPLIVQERSYFLRESVSSIESWCHSHGISAPIDPPDFPSTPHMGGDPQGCSPGE